MRRQWQNAAFAAVAVTSVGAVGVIAAQTATPEPPAATEIAPETESSAQVVERPFLGVRLEAGETGVIVQQVVDGSPAALAGLETGDVITAINGEAVTTPSDLSDVIAGLQVGNTVTLEYTRDEETSTVDVVLAGIANERGRNRGGLRGQLREGLEVEYDAEAQTWTITELSETNPLYEAGLRQGDVITAANGEPLSAPGLGQWLRNADGDGTLTLTIERDGETQDIELSLQALIGSMFDGAFPFGQGGRGQNGNGFFQGRSDLNGYLGLSFIPLDETVAAENDVELTEGALVGQVAEDSPAAEAGIQLNDIITAVNGEVVDAEVTLRDRLMAYEAGDVLTLTIVREGETQQIEVTLGERSAANVQGMFNFTAPDGMNFFIPELPENFQFEVPPTEGETATGANL